MNRILVVGSDSITGCGLVNKLSAVAHVDALRLKDRPSIECPNSVLIDAFDFNVSTGSDFVIFCGGAGKSSWDADFGCLAAEKKWLSTCVEFANRADIQLVYLSSDAVFGGPWVFHSDSDQNFSDSKFASEILQWEGVAAKAAKHLIVRCNVVAPNAPGFLGDLIGRLQKRQDVVLNARLSSTILSDHDFSNALTSCIEVGMTGYVNIGGGERTTPYSFANQLARQLNSPSLISADSSAQPQERALRCERLRKETSANTPLLKETLDHFANLTLDWQPLKSAA